MSRLWEKYHKTGSFSKTLESTASNKKLIPFLNKTSSPKALSLFAEGQSQLAVLQPQSLKKAIGLFEKAIQNDYNYVPAYLGLAEAHAAKSAWERDGNDPKMAGFDSRKARVEFEKAALLNPVLSKEKKAEIDFFLKANLRGCIAK